MENGKLKFSISEERINRIKNWYGNPIRSINEFLNKYNINIKDIDYIATHGSAVKIKNINSKKYADKIKLIKLSNLNNIKKSLIIQLKIRKKREISATKRALKLINELKKI